MTANLGYDMTVAVKRGDSVLVTGPDGTKYEVRADLVRVDDDGWTVVTGAVRKPRRLRHVVVTATLMDPVVIRR